MQPQQARLASRRAALRVAGGLGLAGTALATGVATVGAGAGTPHSIDGSWEITVTESPPGRRPPQRFLATFTIGGGYIGSPANPRLDTSQHGAWMQVGERSFALTAMFRVVRPSTGDAPPPPPNTNKMRILLTLDQSGASFSGRGINQGFDPAGNLLFGGELTAEGRRIEVELLDE